MNYIPIILAAAGSSVTPLTITAEAKDDIAHIIISGHISEWSDASANNIKIRVEGFKNAGITEALVYLNTDGGNIFQATEINNLLEDNFDIIKVRVGALAASAGTYFVAKHHTTAKKNSQFMIHKPMAGVHGNEDEIKSTLKLLKNVTDDYRKVYASKMGLTSAEVNALWDKGDYWMTAKEALKKGLIDAIEGENAKIDAKTQLLMVACGSPVIPELTETQTNNKEMNLKLMALSLGLPETATEADIKAKIIALQAEAKSGTDLKAAADLKETTDKAANIKALLDGGEKDKKFTPELRASYQTLAEADFEGTKKVIDALPGIEAAPSGSIKGSGKPTEVTAEKAKWNYKEWRDGDPSGFENLPEAKQTALLDAHYKED